MRPPPRGMGETQRPSMLPACTRREEVSARRPRAALDAAQAEAPRPVPLHEVRSAGDLPDSLSLALKGMPESQPGPRAKARRKLVFLANAYAPFGMGGAELVMQTLVEALYAQRFEVTVLTLSPTAEELRDKVNGVPIIRVRKPNVYGPTTPRAEVGTLRRGLFHVLDMWNPITFFRLRRLLQVLRPDYVCTHTMLGFSVSAWAAARALGIPVIHTLHDQYLTCPRGTRFHQGVTCEVQCGLCRAMSWPKKLAARNVTAAIGVSQNVLDWHQSLGYFRDRPVRVIFNGRTRIREGGPRALSLPRVPFTFGFLGRIGQYKGIEVLLDAFRAIPTDCRLLVAGSGDAKYTEGLKAKLGDPRVSFVGQQRAGEFLQQLDAVVVPSLSPEPLPTVIIEAWEFGLPVVGSRIGGISEMLGLVGGITVPPNEPKALAEAMLRVMGDPALYSELSRRALAERERFLPERNVDSFLRFLAALEEPVPTLGPVKTG